MTILKFEKRPYIYNVHLVGGGDEGLEIFHV